MRKKILITVFTFILCTSAFCAPQDDVRFVEYYNNAVTLFKANKYSSAILEFRKVLRVKPYDNMVKNALVSAYLARAEYYANQENQPKKATIDLKNALYYLKYWNNENATEKQLAMVNSVQKSLKEIEKSNLIPSQRYDLARFLRTQGELGAAGYEFAQLFNDPTYARRAYESAGDIYKTLNNELDSINSYRAAIKIEPKNALLHFKYAVLMDEIGNPDAAGDEYNLALRYGENNSELLERLEELWLARTIENPQDAQAFVNLGTILQKKGDLQNAKVQYLKAQALNPNDKTVSLNLASLYVSEANWAEAVKLYDAILLKDPKNTEILTYKGVAYEKMNNYKEALNAYNAVLTLNPSNKIAKEAVGDIVKNNFTGAELYYYLEEQAKLKPNDFQTQYDCAYELHKGGEIARAIPYYTKALTINPKNAEGYINLAQIYSTQNNNQKLQETVTLGLKNIPSNKELLTLKDALNKEKAAELYANATSLWEKKQYKEALNLYLQIPLQTPEVLGSIASCYFELNNFNKALEFGQKTLAKTPNDIDSLYIVASSYLELNNPKDASLYLNKILTINPESKEAKDALALIAQEDITNTLDEAIKFYEAKNYFQAILKLDEVIKADPKNTYAFYYKGLAYEEQKKLPEAQAQFQRAITFDPNFIMGYYSLASILDKQEKYAQAVNYYTKFLELKKKENTQNDEYGVYVAKRNTELREYLKNKK